MEKKTSKKVKMWFELSPEENHKLTLYKVKSGWENKKQALKCLIRKTLNQHGEIK